MAELNAIITDTHPLLYYAAGGRKLGARAAAHFQAADEGRSLVYVPMAVVMEVSFLQRAGRGGLRVPATIFFNALFANPAFQAYDLSLEQVFAAEDLRINRDPFDALIVAAAQVLGLPLVTRDTEIVASKAVKVIW